MGLRKNYEFYLGPNEFLNVDDTVGLFAQDVDPETFFSTESIQYSESTNNLPSYPESWQFLPNASVRFQLSDIKRTSERSAYTFMILIGDIGGFNGAVFIFPAFFLSWYNQKMFTSSLYEELPVKKKKTKDNSYSSLQSKIVSNQSFNDGLAADDINSLISEVNSAKPRKIPFFSRLKCHFKFLCRKDHYKQKVREKALANLEDQLDIRSFLSVNKNLSLLVWLLLSKEQLLLFNHHNDRAVTEYADKGKSKPQVYNKEMTMINNSPNIQSHQAPDKVQKLILASEKKPRKVEFEF